MTASEVTGDSTRVRIIRAAIELFRKQGAHRTSPDEIIEASGVGKGQFYHYFKNKQGMIHAVLQYHLDAIENGTFPVNFNVESWEDLQGWFDFHVELQKRFGMTRACPLGMIGSDVTEGGELIRQDVAHIFDVMRGKLGSFFRKESAAGRLAKEADEEVLATFCMGVMQGAMLLGKIARSSRPVEQAASEALAHIMSFRLNL
jgi:TetR/AcrR family transcriptional regulator, transcriptional repressor for nem operon